MKKLIFVLYLVFAAALVQSAFAATVTIRPDSQGARTGWGNFGCSSGSSEWQCVDEASSNTGDYLYTNAQYKESFGFSNTGLSAGTTINSVTLYYYAMQHNTASNSCFEAMTRSGGVDYLAGAQLCGGASWSYLSHSYTTNPATGAAWTVSEVDALEAGMHGLNPNGGGRVAQVYAVVDYVIPDSCTDTDGGNVPAVNGSTYGHLNEAPYSNGDSCADASNVVEYFCSGTQSASLQVGCGADTAVDVCVGGNVYTNSTDYFCGTGKCQSSNTLAFKEVCSNGCSGGVCNPIPDSCSDSDGGNVPAVNGSTSGYLNEVPYSNGDSCADASNVVEYFCSGTQSASLQVGCGADSLVDFCQGGDVYTNSTDNFCGAGRCQSSASTTLKEACQFGCTSGVCNPVPDSCSDSDGGNVPAVFGSTSGYFNEVPYSNGDSCADASNVVEYYCAGAQSTSQQQSCGSDSSFDFCQGGNVYTNSTDNFCGAGRCQSSASTTLKEACQFGCTSGQCNSNAPDLVVQSVNFFEYEAANSTRVNVTTIVKNVGNATAGASTTRLQGLSTTDRFTWVLGAGGQVDFSQDYLCSTNHTYTSTADIFNNVTESNEGNNQGSNYIDCVV